MQVGKGRWAQAHEGADADRDREFCPIVVGQEPLLGNSATVAIAVPEL